MADMIRAENISLAEISGATSFRMMEGEMIVLLTPKDEVNACLTRLLIGLEKPLPERSFFSGPTQQPFPAGNFLRPAAGSLLPLDQAV